MKAIWKFPLEVTDAQIVEVPVASRFLSVAVQNGTFCLWAEVDPSAKKHEPRRVVVVGTGNPFPDHGLPFIGTVLTGPFVWHVFAEGQ